MTASGGRAEDEPGARAAAITPTTAIALTALFKMLIETPIRLNSP